MAINKKLTIFSFFIFLTGICLTYLISYTHSGISDKCVSNQVQLGMNILLMLSVMMMVIPLIQLYCHWGCNCPQNDISYKWIIIIISVLIIAVSSVVLNGLIDNCEKIEVKNLMIGLISTGSVIIFTIGILPLAIPSLKNILNGEDSSDYTSSPSSVHTSSPSSVHTSSPISKNYVPNLD